MPMLEYIGGDPPIGKNMWLCIPTRPGNTVAVEIQRLRVRRYLRGCAWLNRLNLSFADDDGLIVFGAAPVPSITRTCQCNNPRISSYELSIGRRLRKRVHETTEEQGKNGSVLFIGHKIAEPAARP